MPDPSVIPPCSPGDCQTIAAGLELGLCSHGRSAPAALGPLKAGTQTEVWPRTGKGLLFGCVIQHRVISAWYICRNGKDLLKSGEPPDAAQPHGEWTVPWEPCALNQTQPAAVGQSLQLGLQHMWNVLAKFCVNFSVHRKTLFFLGLSKYPCSFLHPFLYCHSLAISSSGVTVAS